MLSLVTSPGLPDEQTTVLSPGTVTIGRTNENHIVCMHKSLSRKHARVDFDGTTLRIADLQSKNGVFFNGQRVATCEVMEGDSFRCGDITFLVEDATTRGPKPSLLQTLPSTLLDSSLHKNVTKAPPAVLDEDLQGYKDKLFLLVRASELLVGELPLDRLLDELVILAVQVLEVDRIALLARDEKTAEMSPKVIKTFVGAAPRPYSKRVVDWVVEHGSPSSFGDVSKDRTLRGDSWEDAQIKAALAVPINPGGRTIGVLYVDSISRTDAFQPEDLALLRALANIAAVAMDARELRPAPRQDRDGFAGTGQGELAGITKRYI